MDKEVLEKYCDDGLSCYKIADIMGKSPTSIRYWLKKYHLKTHVYKTWDREQFLRVVKESNSIREVLVKLGKNCAASNYNSFRRNVRRFNADISHFRQHHHGRRTICDEDIFVKNSSVSKSTLKRRFISLDVVAYRCSICGLGAEWNGHDLILILDHVDGDCYNNSIDNLRLVCPNCNSQLDTHCRGMKCNTINNRGAA